MKSSMKRLAKDQVALRKSLPPNYLFEDEEASQSLPDDLTQLLICLTGPEGTPYSQGIWHLRLDIPLEYPQKPPIATFKTRIFHPNVAEDTGAVCLETLKRDWDPKLTLKDILVTISCLLIQPNPDSALNQKAGALIQEDYEAFAKQAKLMTRIHAPIPTNLLSATQEAKQRGEDKVDRAQVKSPTQVNDQTQAELQKENQSAETEREKTAQQKSAKRSIAEISACGADRSQKEHDAEIRRRKSPKQNHVSSEPSDEASNTIPSRKGKTTEPFHSESLSLLPEKIVFRAQWSTGSGASRPKARIGIRRL